MLQTILANMIEFGKSMPTNLVILTLVCIVMKFAMKKSWKDCAKVVIVYLVIGVLLGMFGLCMPDFVTIFNWIKAAVWG